MSERSWAQILANLASQNVVTLVPTCDERTRYHHYNESPMRSFWIIKVQQVKKHTERIGRRGWTAWRAGRAAPQNPPSTIVLWLVSQKFRVSLLVYMSACVCGCVCIRKAYGCCNIVDDALLMTCEAQNMQKEGCHGWQLSPRFSCSGIILR